MRKFSNATVSRQPDFSSTKNWTLDKTRHVHLLLSCISELTVIFIEDVEPVASFCLKSFLWLSNFFDHSYAFSHPQRPGRCESISSQDGRAPGLKSTHSPGSPRMVCVL